jgi:SPP1 gp7 family putative phage head morphogenesis protein
MYKPGQLRGSKGGLFQRLNRAPSDALIQQLRPPEPRAAELIYRAWARSVWRVWSHVVRSELASLQPGMVPDFATRMHALVNGSALPSTLNRVGRAVTDNVARYMGSIFKRGQAPQGVRLDAAEDFTPVPRINPFSEGQAELIDQWRLENIRLIKNATDEQVAKLLEVFRAAQTEGIAHGELAGMVDEILDDGLNRALLIASDQTTKFNGTVQRVQQTAAGITEFIWSTSHDGAVRPSHKLLDGRKFRWDKGAPDGVHWVLPGEPVRCRCQAIPVIPLFDGLD